MKRIFIGIVDVFIVSLVLFSIALSACTPTVAPVRPPVSPTPSRKVIALKNGTVIDVVTGRADAGVVVLITGDQLSAVGRQIPIPRDAVQVDVTGKFVIPGLWDMHSHNQASGVTSLDLYVAKGVVGTRDMGSDAEFILPLRDRIRRGELLGPEIYAAGPILDDAPGDWPFRRRVTNTEEARITVRELKDRGVDFIKVHNFTPRDVFFAIMAEAPKLGLTVAGHIPLKVTVEEGIDSGMKSIEHFSESRLFRECPGRGDYTTERCRPLFRRIAERGVWQTPTGVFSESTLESFSGQPILHAEYASDGVLDLNRKQLELFKPDEKVLSILRSQNPARRAAVRDLIASGDQFLAGCDGWVPGFCLHDELRWLVEAGLSPLQALQTATVNPAKFLGREQRQGTVETGNIADLVVLDADPRNNIGNVSLIHAVVVRGKLLTRDVIDKMIAAHRRN